MNEIVMNELGHDGMRQIKIISDVQISGDQYLYLIPEIAREHVDFGHKHDNLLGLFSLYISFPVHSMWDVFYHSPKEFRRFMFVHHIYAERVSQCIEMARDAFFASTHFLPMYAYLAELLPGAEIGMDVHGCILQVAEWMPKNCVAVGGCDVG